MTRQETFNTVAEHLRKQGKKAIESGTCLYRGARGLKCAAGALIPDADYCADMEELAVGHNPLVDDILKRDGHSIDLVKELQFVHDHYEPEQWETRLAILAQDWELTMPQAMSGPPSR